MNTSNTKGLGLPVSDKKIFKVFAFRVYETKFDLTVKKVKVNPRSSNFIGSMSPILHTKPQGHWPFDSEEDFYRVFTIYGHGSHLDHATQM